MSGESARGRLLEQLEAQLRGGQPGFREILDHLAEAVTIRDRHHHILYANRAALERMGFASMEELTRQPPQSIFEGYTVTDEHGDPVTMDDIPSVRLLEGKPAEPLVLRTVQRSGGTVRWSLLKAAPLHDESGERLAAVTIIEDITGARLAALRSRFLTGASDTLMSSLDYEQTLRNVAWLAVPEVADWCAVDLISPDGERQQVVVAHRDEEKLALAEKLRRFEPQELDPEQGLGRVMRTGKPELYPEITDEMLEQAASSEEHLHLLRAVGFRSALLVPLSARGRNFGVMTLVTAESMRRFDDEDTELAMQVANRAAVAVDNARLATVRRETAHTLQRSLLPELVPKIPGWEVAAFYSPASGDEEVEVGGDFYDFFESPAGWVVVLADVTGKGVEAAALTSLVRHGARFLSRYEDRPSRILAGLNHELREQAGLQLCTAMCMRLGPSEVLISSAGHPSPMVVRRDGRTREICMPGPLLGAWSEDVLRDELVHISSEETLFIYTDGLIDARRGSERFGASRLREALLERAELSPQELLDQLEHELDRFGEGAQSDDKAAVAMRPLPVESHSEAEASRQKADLRILRASP